MESKESGERKSKRGRLGKERESKMEDQRGISARRRQGIQQVRRRRMRVAVLFLVLEATSSVLDQIGGTHLGFRVASFVLSIIGFLLTAYSYCATRSPTDRDVIELVFAIVQLLMTCVYLSMSIFRVKFNSNIPSIFPLVLAVTSLALEYEHTKLVQDPTPNTSERDEEEGFTGTLVHPIHDVVASDNQSMVDKEEDTVDSRALLSLVDNETLDSRVLHPLPSQLPIMVDEEETTTPRMSEEEEIAGTSRASLILSDTPMMSDGKEIEWSDSNNEMTDSTAAPPTPAICSTIKIFSKFITRTDLEKELIVPNEAREHFLIPEGQDFVDLLVKDMKGDVWKFCLIIKPTPVLTEGWVEFVQANGVVQDEIVTFYKQQNEDFEGRAIHS